MKNIYEMILEFNGTVRALAKQIVGTKKKSLIGIHDLQDLLSSIEKAYPEYFECLINQINMQVFEEKRGQIYDYNILS